MEEGGREMKGRVRDEGRGEREKKKEREMGVCV